MSTPPVILYDHAYGDFTSDAEAAVRGGMKPIGVLTGGFSEHQLREAGCVEVYPEVGAILRT